MKKLFLLILLIFASACTTPDTSANKKPDNKSQPKAEIIWPVSESITPDALSSTFGPRLKASESFRYDFHRGIDIPTPLNTELVAIADGEVRLAGMYPSYSDMLVQIKHLRKDGTFFYTNYLHLAGTAVSEGDTVKQGQVVAYSGKSVSGFEHLHFEIRDGGLYQLHAVHPLLLLPYEDKTAPSIQINSVDVNNPQNPIVDVAVSTLARELDINHIEVELYDNGTMIDSQSFDMTAWNKDYTPKDDPNLNLDNPDFNNIKVSPAKFNTSTERYELTLRFEGLNSASESYQIKVTVKDIKGNTTTINY